MIESHPVRKLRQSCRTYFSIWEDYTHLFTVLGRMFLHA